MSSHQQQSITRFFTPKTKKTEANPKDSGDEKSNKKSPEAKKRPLETSSTDPQISTSPPSGDAKDEPCSSPQSPMSSPEAKKRALDNRLSAKIKLKSKGLAGALHPTVGPSWFEALQAEFDKPYFVQLNSFLQGERGSQTIYPPVDQVWSWTRDFAVKETRVVILGQDPYHGPGQAHGLCFSVQKGIKIPPSLVNMYKELAADENVDFEHPGHGCLQGWADQGVLLLNACLTVRKANANSHKDRGWEKVTDRVIKAVSDECPPGVVFLLWGAFAAKKAASVDAKKHHLLKTVHPSPLSAHRGFLGCRHFSKANEFLVKAGRKPVDWGKLP